MLSEAYFRRCWITWVKRLHLGHWEWDIHLGVDLDDAFAQITPHQHYDEARLEVRRDWPHWTKEVLNNTVVHELVHVTLRDVDTVLHMPCELDVWDNSQAAILYHEHMDHAVEGFIQRITGALIEAHGIVK